RTPGLARGSARSEGANADRMRPRGHGDTARRSRADARLCTRRAPGGVRAMRTPDNNRAAKRGHLAAAELACGHSFGVHLNVRPVVEEDGGVLSTLAAEAKAHWGYSAEVMQTWQSQLTVNGADVRSKLIFVAMVDDQVAGFYSLATEQSSWEIDNLWVLP